MYSYKDGVFQPRKPRVRSEVELEEVQSRLLLVRLHQRNNIWGVWRTSGCARPIAGGPHDPNSLLHGGFEYLEKSGNDARVPLLPDDRGRRHLTVGASATEQFRPCRRVLTPGFSGAAHARAQGLARIEATPHPTPRQTGLRANAIAAGRSGYDVPDPGLVLQSKHMVMDDNGRPARERVYGELTLEKAFGLKRKVNTQREKRGGIPEKGNPGDKLFHHVDYSPGFHQIGESTVGSSFYRTMPRRGREASPGVSSPAAAVPEGLGYALGYRKPKMDFHESRQASRYVDDLRAVLELTEEAPTQLLPAGHGACTSWEDKTGMHTWPRKVPPAVDENAAATGNPEMGATEQE